MPTRQQGLAYIAQFSGRYHLGIVMVVTLIAAAIVFVRDKRIVVLPCTIGAYVALHVLYVTRVGGDFMEGRFLVPTLPLFYLLVETALGAVVATSAVDSNRLAPRALVNGVTDERTWQPVVDEWYREGMALGAALPHGTVVATDGIGAFGWASDLTIVDTLGLTDAYVARLPMAQRGRPGHERRAPIEYPRKRNVAVLRDGMHLYDMPGLPDWVNAGNRYFVLSDDPILREAFSAARQAAAR